MVIGIHWNRFSREALLPHPYLNLKLSNKKTVSEVGSSSSSVYDGGLEASGRRSAQAGMSTTIYFHVPGRGWNGDPADLSRPPLRRP